MNDNMRFDLLNKGLYFTVYAEAIKGGHSTFFCYKGGADLDASMAVVKTTVMLVLQQTYPNADVIRVITRDEYENAKRDNPGAIGRTVVNLDRFVQPMED